jgi:hypothetical protein
MTKEQKDIIRLTVKLGLYGAIITTAASIPVALWAIPKWKQDPWISTIILTLVSGGIGLIMKEVMISHAEETPPLVSELR